MRAKDTSGYISQLMVLSAQLTHSLHLLKGLVPSVMNSTRVFLTIGALLICESTCFHEEQSTTPMKALQVLNGIVSPLACWIKCYNEAMASKCVSASYGEKNRQCHLHTHATIAFPSCGVTPYKRFLKTETNCIGASGFATDYVRTNLIREHGTDPCFPDPSFLHPELVNGNGSPPVCPIRKLDGSEGPVYTFRGVDITGKYTSFDNNNIARFEYSAAENVWYYYYQNVNEHRMVSAVCAEIGDDCSCGPLPPMESLPAIINRSPPIPNVIGACPGRRLFAKQFLFSDPYAVFNGDTVKVFCSGGFWFAGENSPGNLYRLSRAICAD